MDGKLERIFPMLFQSRMLDNCTDIDKLISNSLSYGEKL
jgi:hypothetical protein